MPDQGCQAGGCSPSRLWARSGRSRELCRNYGVAAMMVRVVMATVMMMIARVKETMMLIMGMMMDDELMS